MNLLDTLAAVEQGVYNTVSVAVACAAAGIIVGSVIMTGLGIRFSRFAIELSGGELLYLLLLIMVSSIILGMGMPTVSAYIVLAVIAAPAVVDQGIFVIAAHLFVFYFGIISGITPPVAITAYVTAGIANADPMRTALKACKIGLGGFILPYMFVYNPNLLLQGDPLHILISILTSIIGCVSFAGALQGYLLDKLALYQRLFLLISALSLVKYGIITDLVGISLMGLVLLTQIVASKKEKDKAQVM